MKLILNGILPIDRSSKVGVGGSRKYTIITWNGKSRQIDNVFISNDSDIIRRAQNFWGKDISGIIYVEYSDGNSKNVKIK
jgi:hypothetical protein